MNIFLIVIFVGIISFLFIKSLVNPETNYRNECIAIGILGTFIGITISLFHFDSGNISSSIPDFLDGLKIAFITSAFGMTASSILSFRKPDSEVSNLEKLIILQEENNKIIHNALNNLSANATDEIIKSLEKVIYEFNQHVEHQLGDNFAELNKAFSKLVEWQDQYKSMIDNQYSLIERQHNLTMSKLEKFKSIEEERSNALSSQNNEFLMILNSHALELQEQSKLIEITIDSIKTHSINITKSMDDSVDSVNKKINTSVTLAEESIAAIIGLANGKLR